MLLAYHSHHVIPTADHYEQALVTAGVDRTSSLESSCLMFSSVTGQVMTGMELSPSYWVRNLVSTVKFSAALTACAGSSLENLAYLELGPHSALQGPLKETIRGLGNEHIHYFHSCLRQQDDLEAMLLSAGSMLASGIDLDTIRINAQETFEGEARKSQVGNLLTDIPSYCWNHSTSFWYESRISRNLRSRRFRRHPLLGSRYLEDIPSHPSWRNLLMLKELPWLLNIKDSNNVGTQLKIMPSAVFVLMALEAASQLQTALVGDANSLFLSNVVFGDDLPLTLFTNPETIIELHLNAHMISDGSAFTFDITSYPTDGLSLPIHHCKGEFGWETHTENTRLPDFKVRHNPFLLEQTHFLGWNDLGCLKPNEIGCEGSKGTFKSPDISSDYTIHPLVLDSVLQAPSISALGSTFPFLSKLSSIKYGTLSVRSHDTGSGLFAVNCRYLNINESKSDIELLFGDSQISWSDVQFAAVPYDSFEAPPNSLFFKEMEMRDISMTPALEQMSIVSCLHLLAHKWPMCDIGVSGLSSGDEDIIINLFRCQNIQFRSLQTVSDAKESSDDYVRHVPKFDMSSPLHALFLDDGASEVDAYDALHSRGLLCVRATKRFDQKENFELLCKITGFSDDGWFLYRKAAKVCSPAETNRPVKIFLHPGQRALSLEIHGYGDIVSLQVDCVRDFCQRDNKGAYDAIVFDSAEKSIISIWAGNDLIPWLQDLLVFSKRIIWVTQTDPENPFLCLAGNLLRTLQSEQPSLEVKWMMFDKGTDQLDIEQAIESAFVGALSKDKETQYKWKGSQMLIKRYLPDLELSALTGVALPQVMHSPCNSKDYELVTSDREQLTALISNPAPFQGKSIDDDPVTIRIEASVIADHEVREFYSLANPHHRHPGLRFFAGRVISNSRNPSESGACVTGWHPTVHCGQTAVPHNQLYYPEENMSPQCQAVLFATLCTSLSIVDGFAHIRPKDTFEVKVSGDLREMIERLVKEFGGIILDSNTTDHADFTIIASAREGILINESPLEMKKYLASRHGRSMVNKFWKSLAFPVMTRSFELADFKGAYESYNSEEPCCSVFIHENVDRIERRLAVYKKPDRLFSDGVYIIIGGLGGLGRFICSWMASNGASHIIVISRSGLSTQEAQDTFKAINATNATMEVMKADACNKQAIALTFAHIRQHQRIKGVINLAMLLSDAPLAQMTGEEWDRALRLKVDSSWILHEETLQDDLEFFILFSSIASVLGNRNQAGYNVGNTFLNALAAYRHSLNLPGVSIALGAMSKSNFFSPSKSPFPPLHLDHQPKLTAPFSSF